MRIGHGFDAHRLVKGRKLILGGVQIEHPTGLEGHSDADVLTHAITDALLGASGASDIGTLFPNTDDKYKGADSLELLSQACHLISQKGYSIVSIDSTIIAQEPYLSPYIKKMIGNIARACGITADKVNVKATTEEGMGYTGAKTGIAAHAVCLLQENN